MWGYRACSSNKACSLTVKHEIKSSMYFVPERQERPGKGCVSDAREAVSFVTPLPRSPVSYPPPTSGKVLISQVRAWGEFGWNLSSWASRHLSCAADTE